MLQVTYYHMSMKYLPMINTVWSYYVIALHSFSVTQEQLNYIRKFYDGQLKCSNTIFWSIRVYW